MSKMLPLLVVLLAPSLSGGLAVAAAADAGAPPAIEPAQLMSVEPPLLATARYTGPVTDDDVKPVISFIKKANDLHAKAIILEINSPGGSVEAGFLLVKAIEDSKVIVACIVDGEGMSMAFYILQACDIRFMTRRSVLMTHTVRMQAAEGAVLTEEFILHNLEAVRAYSRASAEYIASRMKISYGEYMKHVAGNRDWLMHHVDAVKYHAVDFVVDSVKEAAFLVSHIGDVPGTGTASLEP